MRFVSLALGILASSVLWVGSGNALVSDTWVTGAGTDTGTCPQTAPCRTLSYAATQTEAGGAIHFLGPTTQDSVFIDTDKAYSIIGDGPAAFAGQAFAAAITVRVNPTDEVTIRGIAINQRAGNNRGIWFLSGGALHLQDCVIFNGGSEYGIEFAPTGASELHISNCVISDGGSGTAGGGILIRPTGSGSAKIVLDNVRIENNRVGILIDGGATTGAITMNISDSEIGGSGTQGLGVFEGVSGGASAVVLERTTISSNGAQGIIASRALASVRVRQSAITGNTIGVQSLNGGQIISHGDNVLAGNTTNGAFTSTVAPQ